MDVFLGLPSTAHDGRDELRQTRPGQRLVEASVALVPGRDTVPFPDAPMFASSRFSRPTTLWVADTSLARWRSAFCWILATLVLRSLALVRSRRSCLEPLVQHRCRWRSMSPGTAGASAPALTMIRADPAASAFKPAVARPHAPKAFAMLPCVLLVLS